MKDRSMHPNLAALRESLLCRAEKPAAKFVPTIYVFDLLIVFHVIADEEIGALTLPQAAPNALLCTTSEDAEPMSVLHPDDNVALSLRFKALNVEMLDQILVLEELFLDVAQLLDRAVFGGADEDDVIGKAE